jgi:MraZ protein
MVNMLIGNYSSKLNGQGRAAIPKKFRDQLGDHLVLLQGYEGCLVLVAASALDTLVQPDKPFILDVARETDRFLLGNAFEVEPDGQGRFIVPPPLRTYAELNSAEVVFVGIGNRVELWDPQRWEAYQQNLAQRSSQIANQLVNQMPAANSSKQ